MRGYSALIEFTEGNEKFYKEFNGENICLAGDGYKWLMILPLDEHWCITAFYDANGKIIEWYFDISKQNFIDENGLLSIDDMYLDLVLLPDGSTVMLDEDELIEALQTGAITQADYNFAHKIYGDICTSKWIDTSYTGSICNTVLSEYNE